MIAGFARDFARLGGAARAGVRRHYKRRGHRRHRAAERAYLTRGNWEGEAFACRPVTGWDAF